MVYASAWPWDQPKGFLGKKGNGMTEQQTKIAKRFALLDLILVGPMALPGLAHILIGLFILADGAAGVQSPLGQMNEAGMLFVNVVGVLAAMWAIARLLDPTALTTKIDAYARLAVALLLVYYWASVGFSIIFVVFLVSEIGGAAVQLMALKKKDQPV